MANAMDHFETIGANIETEPEFRELTMDELARPHSFSDYFRFSFTARMDRDDALALARKIEQFISESRRGDVRVYLGVRNR